MKVGDSVNWNNPSGMVTIPVTVLWLPSTQKAKYGEPLALVDHNGEPKLVPVRCLQEKKACPSKRKVVGLGIGYFCCANLEHHESDHSCNIMVTPSDGPTEYGRLSWK